MPMTGQTTRAPTRRCRRPLASSSRPASSGSTAEFEQAGWAGPDGQDEDEGEQVTLAEDALPTEQAADQPEQVGPDEDQPDDPDMPMFHRMWSSPTPPESTA